MDIETAIDSLDSFIHQPMKGLPEEVFLFVSRLTPLTNVDLLIKNDCGQTLLTWREDAFHQAGWHIPGGIIRFKETFADRISAVADQELGARISFALPPLAIREYIHPSRDVRGHFISFLIQCSLVEMPDEVRKYRQGTHPQNGQWAWHNGCPDDLLAVHKEMYRVFF